MWNLRISTHGSWSTSEPAASLRVKGGGEWHQEGEELERSLAASVAAAGDWNCCCLIMFRVFQTFRFRELAYEAVPAPTPSLRSLK